MAAESAATRLSGHSVGAPAHHSPPRPAPLAGAATGAQQQLAAATAPHAIASATPVFSATLDGAFRLDQYHKLDEIYAFMEALARAYKGRVRVFTIGRSSERRPIKALELVNNATDADFVWLDALTHAREWITGSTILYALDRLVSMSGAPAHSLVHAKNYIFVPVVNPDGYAYTWTTNRMWRKNRSRQSQSSLSAPPLNIGARSAASQCFGVSLWAHIFARSPLAARRFPHH